MIRSAADFMISLRIDNRALFLLTLSVFALVEVSDLLVPYRAERFSLDSLIVYYAAFFFVFCGLAVSCFFRFSAEITVPSVTGVATATNFLVFLSFGALLLVMYDRLFIQGVDYSQGIAQAREAWRALAADREGASSIFNVVGNLLFPFVYFAIAFCVLFFERSGKFRRNFYFSVVLVFAFSAITGGRELLLVLFGVFLSSLSLRYAFRLSLLAKVMKKDFFLIFLVALTFSVYVGYLRSQSYDFGMDEYGRSLATRLGASGEKTAGVGEYTPDVILPVLIYLAHVKWVFINMIGVDGGEGLSTFRQIFKMFLDYLALSFEWVDYQPPAYTPNWISLIGSVYYDLGWLGIFLYSVALAFSPFIFCLLFSIREFNGRGFSLAVYLFFSAIVIFSPFAFLFEVVQFIYLLVFVFFVFFASFLPVRKSGGLDSYESRLR